MNDQDTFKGVDKILDDLKERSPKSKDYYKYLITLSTGTLIFSVTFLKEFGTYPEYKFILLIGWFSLVSSVIAGVLLLPKSDQLQFLIEQLKKSVQSPQVTVSVIKKEYLEYHLKEWIKVSLGHIFKGDDKRKGEIIQAIDKYQVRDLNNFFEQLMLTSVKDAKFIKWAKQFKKQLYKMLLLANKLQKISDPVLLIKDIRITLIQLIWFNRVMIYGFFTGILAISIFSIINFLD